MLDKQSKVVLNHLISIANENNVIYDSDKIYSLDSKYTKKQINDSIEYLDKIGYIKAFFADNKPYNVYINYEGLHYKDFDRIRIKNFIMESILTPIIVSFITTLLALWLNGYFIE